MESGFKVCSSWEFMDTLHIFKTKSRIQEGITASLWIWSSMEGRAVKRRWWFLGDQLWMYHISIHVALLFGKLRSLLTFLMQQKKFLISPCPLKCIGKYRHFECQWIHCKLVDFIRIRRPLLQCLERTRPYSWISPWNHHCNVQWIGVPICTVSFLGKQHPNTRTPFVFYAQHFVLTSIFELCALCQ